KIGSKLGGNIVPARRAFRIEILRRLNVDMCPRMNDQFGVILLDGDYGSGVAEVVYQIGLGRRSGVDQQTMAKNGLTGMRAGSQMQQMMGLRDRRRIAVEGAMANLKVHKRRPNRV